MIILIADDERLVRFTVKSILADIITEDYTVLEAANGRDMINLCIDKQPDIVFADISMPYVNGLDAIEECRSHTEKTEYVIISGYSEFEYARRGIALGINEYLLKPIEAEKLEEVVQTIQKKLYMRKRESNSAFQLKLLDMFNYFSTAGIQEDYTEFRKPKEFQYVVFGLFMKNSRKKEEDADLQDNIMQSVQKLGDEIVKSGEYYALVYSGEGTPYFVFAAADAEHCISRMKKLNMLLLYGTGNRFFYFTCASMKEIYKTAEEIDADALAGMNYKTGLMLEYRTIRMKDREKGLLVLIRKLLDAWDNADGVAYKEILNQMYKDYKDTPVELNLEHVAAYCSEVTGEKIESATYKSFCKSFVDISEKMYENVEPEDNDMIEQVKEYIQKYYMNDISISQIGEQYHLTANYLSTLFHKRSGCRFIDYLTETRILNAKKLLVKNSTATIQDIAMMVGYNSTRHFSALFQKQIGVTPTAYRKSRL